jgi:biopolymer transport protein ExbD
MRKLNYRLVAVLTFALGLSVYYLRPGVPSSGNAAPDTLRGKLVGTFVPALTVCRMCEDSDVKPSSRYMILGKPLPERLITEPVLSGAEPLNLVAASGTQEALTNPNLIEWNCGTLLVSVKEDRTLTVNGDYKGTLDDTMPLRNFLKGIFDERKVQRVYLSGMADRLDVPDDERIPSTVLIDVPQSLSYGEVVKLIETVKGANANQVVLQVRDFDHPANFNY